MTIWIINTDRPAKFAMGFNYHTHERSRSGLPHPEIPPTCGVFDYPAIKIP
jgi:hypothetical protein